ncbi:MAG: saccharopine dehydrogenase NADP-binding domain-containing protein [Candidatus Cloacimonetes bacterium]|nr:saccharopine dehydrogenase NADP-binding domain-containing protein [Candidatus Cloacimonadota bacterium]
MRVIIMGAGLVGSPMAIDLVQDKNFEVTAVDIEEKPLQNLSKNYNINTIKKDLSYASNLRELLHDYDLVINAVPGFMGFKTLKAIIEAGKDVVDIAFFPEDPFQLNGLAKKNGVTAIVDCGVAPGMSNILVGYEYHRLDKVDSVVIYVGGLPQKRELPFEYKAVFSPIDVIEEYLRPARYIENGKPVIREAISEPEIINFPEVGSLEAFNTDGLRTLAETLPIPNMKEKTLRYPGHIDKIRLLREMGLLSKNEIKVNGKNVRPLDVTTSLLFPQWQLKKDDKDITIMRIIIKGMAGKRKKQITYNLIDKYDEKTGIHSMARTTGYTATMCARLIAEKLFHKPGINAPEAVSADSECVEFILAGLEKRGVFYKRKVK